MRGRSSSRRPLRKVPRRAARRRGRPAVDLDTRAALFHAASLAFSAHGFDGVRVDDIAREARVNKAMLYYHFRDKLGLYREVVREMLRDAEAQLKPIAEATDAPAVKMQRFVATFLARVEARPWIPTLMLREIAEGAPHLDVETLGLMRNVFGVFVRILTEGQRARVFRDVHPVLAYMSAIAPLLLNAARERAAARPGRAQLPMFAAVSREELRHHLQRAVICVLAKD
jgi:AcrR family transcriptional regulator